MNKQLLEVVKANGLTVSGAIGSVCGVGLILSAYGARTWHNLIQKRDDAMAALQLEKLQLEVEKLRRERLELDKADEIS